MESIGLRELNQNPSRAVARVRAGASIVVTDRGRPILHMVPVAEPPTTLQRMVAAGEARAPSSHDMPDVIPDLAPEVVSLAEILVADRERERNR
jgi:prevent-host-death family protein